MWSPRPHDCSRWTDWRDWSFLMQEKTSSLGKAVMTLTSTGVGQGQWKIPTERQNVLALSLRLPDSCSLSDQRHSLGPSPPCLGAAFLYSLAQLFSVAHSSKFFPGPGSSRGTGRKMQGWRSWPAGCHKVQNERECPDGHIPEMLCLHGFVW